MGRQSDGSPAQFILVSLAVLGLLAVAIAIVAGLPSVAGLWRVASSQPRFGSFAVAGPARERALIAIAGAIGVYPSYETDRSRARISSARTSGVLCSSMTLAFGSTSLSTLHRDPARWDPASAGPNMTSLPVAIDGVSSTALVTLAADPNFHGGDGLVGVAGPYVMHNGWCYSFGFLTTGVNDTHLHMADPAHLLNFPMQPLIAR
jgi:hypothetical protein